MPHNARRRWSVLLLTAAAISLLLVLVSLQPAAAQSHGDGGPTGPSGQAVKPGKLVTAERMCFTCEIEPDIDPGDPGAPPARGCDFGIDWRAVVENGLATVSWTGWTKCTDDGFSQRVSSDLWSTWPSSGWLGSSPEESYGSQNVESKGSVASIRMPRHIQLYYNVLVTIEGDVFRSCADRTMFGLHMQCLTQLPASTVVVQVWTDSFPIPT